MDISLALTVSAFIAGMLMFLAPCTLPLIPAYIAFISGVRPEDLTNKATEEAAKHSIRTNSFAFVLGFSLIFITFGVLAGLFGTIVGPFREVIAQIGGIFIILFGLIMLRVVVIAPLGTEKRFTIPKSLHPGHPLSACIIGAIFALGWTPCIGPVLASILLLASTSTSIVSGAFLLSVFSLGLAIPFLLTAALYTRASNVIEKYSYITKFVAILGGIFLILIGFLLLTNNFGATIVYGYKLFSVLGFDGLFELY